MQCPEDNAAENLCLTNHISEGGCYNPSLEKIHISNMIPLVSPELLEFLCQASVLEDAGYICSPSLFSWQVKLLSPRSRHRTSSIPNAIFMKTVTKLKPCPIKMVALFSKRMSVHSYIKTMF